MTKTVSLEALLRRMSRLAEKHFDEHGDVDPMFLVETARGEQSMIIAPIVADNPLNAHAVKDILATKAREEFAKHDVKRYAFAAEAWMSKNFMGPNMSEEEEARRYAALGYTLANAPDRKEIVTIEAADGRELLYAMREIVRPAHGRAYLGKLGEIRRPDHVRGRFLDLLPRERMADGAMRIRRSSELPDDAGTVFVTMVPGAKFQAMGRRDPATGELCVGSIIFTPPGGVLELDSIPFDYVERVTGPEAERLVAELVRRMTAGAQREGVIVEEYVTRRSETKESRH
jgi:hypothetical protein